MICGGGGVERVIDGGECLEGSGDEADGGVVGGTTFKSGTSGAAAGVGSSTADPAGPGVGLRPSRRALAMSAAFHLAYLIFSSTEDMSMAALSESKTWRSSRKLEAARNFLAVFLHTNDAFAPSTMWKETGLRTW